MKTVFLTGKRTLVTAVSLLLIAAVIITGVNRVRAANPGDLDTTFGINGARFTDYGTGTVDEAHGVTVQQADGKIIAVGSTDNNMAIIRYDANGDLDTTFGGGDGKVDIAVSANADVAEAVALDSSGNIIVAGFSDDGAAVPIAFVVARLTSTGVLDTNFDTDGIVSLGFAALGGTTTAGATAVTIDSNDNIIVAGQVDEDFAVMRLLASNGALDTTGFNSPDGYNTVDITGSTRADESHGVVIQSSGRIVLGGFTDTGDEQNFALAGFTSSGALDTNFGANGVYNYDVSGDGSNDLAYSLALDNSDAANPDRLVMAGFVDGAGTIALARFDVDGGQDFAFSGDGRTTIDAVAGQNDAAYGVLVQSTGKIIMVGFTTNATSNENFLAVRVNTDGSLDAGFGTAGVVETDLGTPLSLGSENINSQDEAFAAALTPQNQLIVAGLTDVPLASGDFNFGLAKYDLQNTPPVVSNFTKNGTEDTNVTFAASDFTGNFTDANTGETLQKVQITALPISGTLKLSAVDVTLNQEILAANLGNLAYVPNLDYNSDDGNDSFGWNGSDGQDYADTAATVTLSLTPVNDPPTFTLIASPNQSVAEDAGAQAPATAVIATSSVGPANESGQTISFDVVNNNNTLFSVQPAIDADGFLTYTPADEAFGTATVTVNANDGQAANNTSATDTFTIEVTAVNDPPSLTLGTDPTVAEDAGAQTISNWVTNVVAGPANESTQQLELTTLTVSNPSLFAVGGGPAISLINSGSLSFTPAADAFGSSTVSFNLFDNGGGDDTSPLYTFTITVTAVNDEPSFTPGSDITVAEDSGQYTETAWATNLDKGAANESDQTLTFHATAADPTLFLTQPALNANGNLIFTPAANKFGSTTVDVYVTDNGSTTNPGDDNTSPTETFTITVTPVNDPPTFTTVPLNGDVTVAEDSSAYDSLWIDTLSAGPFETGQQLSISISNTNNALFSQSPSINLISGNLSFTPNPDAFGISTVTVVLTDDGGTPGDPSDDAATAPFAFNIEITAVNDTPSFTKGADDTVAEDAGAQTVTGWATNIDKGAANESAQILTFNVSSDNADLFAAGPAISADGTLTYTPADDANGSATVTVSLSDDGGGADTSADQTFTITVTAVNDAPSFTPGGNVSVPIQTAAAGTTVTGWATNISNGPANETGETLTFNVSTDNDAAFAVLPTIDPTTGTLTFTANGSAAGTITVTVSLSDDGGTPAITADDAVSPAITFTIQINHFVYLPLVVKP